MIATRFMELRKRRGLMITLIVLTIGLPTLFLAIRLVLHAFAPDSYGPAGSYGVFNALTVSVLYVFAFIAGATLGCTAGSIDLTDGMFTHLVITGRSRMALYLARIPSGLAIVVPMIAIAFTIICFVCVFSAPTKFDFQGVNVPLGLSQKGFENWATNHPDVVICDFPFSGPCNGPSQPTTPLSKAQAVEMAQEDYSSYDHSFLFPPNTLMVRTGLWIELEATVAFIVGLGFASLMGQRTVPVVVMIVFEIILGPILIVVDIPHLINLQRSVLDLAVAHLEPTGLGLAAFAGGAPGAVRSSSSLVSEPTIVAIFVIVSWLVGWTALGAWRMMTRDAG